MTRVRHKSQTVSDSRVEKPLQSLFLTISFYPLMFLWVVIGLLASPLAFFLCKLSTGWKTPRIVRFIIRIHGRGMLVIASPFISIERRDLDKIQHPCILVVNHLSFFDSYFMSALPFFDMAFAVGAWPFRMFWYSRFMRLADYLDVESISWEETLEICRRVFSDNAGVLFFPEGHRSRNGDIQQFQSGAFRLAVETGIPIVPLCITGTDRLLPPGHFRLHPANIILKALSPVYPETFSGSMPHIKMRRYVHNLMATEIQKMREELC